MSEINEILFHSLQRFDKKDADDLQKHVYDYLKTNLVKGTLGNVAGKITVDDVDLTYNSSTDRYTLNTSFDYLSTDQRFLTANSGLSFDASGVRNYFTNYLSANSNLTSADTWYVWARPDESEEANESREFFSPIDNAAENRNVNTRKVTRTILAANRTRPDNNVGWTRVAKYEFGFATINGVLVLTGPDVKAVTFTDYMSFGLQDLKIVGTSGLQTITYALEEAMRRILSDGTEDLTGTPETQPGSQPTMSLEGLTKFVKEQTYSKRGHIVLQFTANSSFPSGDIVDLADITKIAPYNAPVVVEDYRRLGFAGVVVPHAYDARRYVVPMDDTYLTNLLSDYNIGTNAMQDVNVMITYEDNSKADNVNDYFDPLRPDATFFLGRNESVVPQRFLTIYGNNGPWIGITSAEYATTVGGVNYANSTGIGILFPLCKGANSNLDTLGTPNIQEMNKIFIDYNNTSGSEALNNYETGVLRYMEPPTFELHLIVKG